MAAHLVGPGGEIEVNNDTGNPLRVIGSSAPLPFDYDDIELSYTGSDLTGVVYKLAAATVATVALGYTGSNLTSVVWS